MKLRIQLSRMSSEGEKMTAAFDVGKSITKKDLQQLFSANEQEEFHTIKPFTLNTNFNEDTYVITLKSPKPSALLNNQGVFPEKVFPINRSNEVQFSEQKFQALLVIGRGTKK